MKKIITNIMTTTGITLVVLAIIGTLFRANYICISSVFESLGANVLIHLGFKITNKFESRYSVLETLLDISYTIVILFIFGYIFNWYASVPMWILAIMAIVVYLLGCFINIFRIQEDVKIINELVQNRNHQTIK